MSNVRELVWNIGGIEVLVEGSHGNLPLPWESLYSGFQGAPLFGSPPLSTIRLNARPVPGYLDADQAYVDVARRIPRRSPWHVLDSEQEALLIGPDYTGRLVQRRSAFLGEVQADATEEALRFLLISSLQVAVTRLGGLVLHASGVLRRGRLWLFTGFANAGKTTIATRLAKDGVPFSLDRVILHRGVECPMAYPTPFSDEAGQAGPRPPLAPAGICLIRQGRQHEAREMSPAQLAHALSLHSLPRGARGETWSRVLDNAAWLATRVLGVELQFAKDPGFWDVLDNLAASAPGLERRRNA